MSYHESLSVTVGAAAPVVVLAAGVAYAETARAQDHYTRADLATDLPEHVLRLLRAGRSRAGRALSNSFIAAVINIVLQLVVLSMALYSLAHNSDVTPPLVPEILVPLGIVLLLASTIMNAVVRSAAALLEQQDLIRRREIKHLERPSSARPDEP